MKKRLLSIILLFFFTFTFCQKEQGLKLTKVNNLLEALSLFSNTTQKEIDSINLSQNFKIDFISKFDDIERLIVLGTHPFYDVNLIPEFKKNYLAYRNGNIGVALLGFENLMKKGFGPATYIYAKSFKNIKERNKFLKTGISQCCDVCTIPIMSDYYDKEMKLDLPSKCYK